MEVMQPINQIGGLIGVHTAIDFSAIAGGHNGGFRHAQVGFQCVQGFTDALRCEGDSFANLDGSGVMIEANGN